MDEKELQRLIKESLGEINLKEFDNYNYPPGADADPNAPWNQPEPPEFVEYDVIDDGDSVDDFSVTVQTDDGGTYTDYLYKILSDLSWQRNLSKNYSDPA